MKKTIDIEKQYEKIEEIRGRKRHKRRKIRKHQKKYGLKV